MSPKTTINIQKYIALAISLLTIPFVLFYVSPFYASFLTLVLLYIVAAESWNLLGGYLGQISFGQAAFFGIGAYTVALPYLYPQIPKMPVGVDVILGGAVCMVVGLILAFPLFRVSGVYFAIAMLSVSEVMRIVLVNSPIGLTGIGGVGITVSHDFSTFDIFLFTFAATIIVLFVIRAIVNSPTGLAFVAINENKDAASTLGINVFRHKILCFMISAFFMGVAGAWFAYFNRYVSPDVVFSVNLSFYPICLTIFGGKRSIEGPIIGSVVILAIEQISQFYVTYGYQIAVGILLVIMCIFAPGGIYGIVTKKERTTNLEKLTSISRKIFGVTRKHKSQKAENHRGTQLEPE